MDVVLAWTTFAEHATRLYGVGADGLRRGDGWYLVVTGASPPDLHPAAIFPGAPPQAAVYSATKAAVDAVTRSFSKELGPRKIRVNSINPGMVETEGTQSTGVAESEMRTQIEASTPLGRIGQPGDIAPAAVFLASSDSAWITGETFYISGGFR